MANLTEDSLTAQSSVYYVMQGFDGLQNNEITNRIIVPFLSCSIKRNQKLRGKYAKIQAPVQEV